MKVEFFWETGPTSKEMAEVIQKRECVNMQTTGDSAGKQRLFLLTPEHHMVGECEMEGGFLMMVDAIQETLKKHGITPRIYLTDKRVSLARYAFWVTGIASEGEMKKSIAVSAIKRIEEGWSFFFRKKAREAFKLLKFYFPQEI
jgi:hypothetical protein